MKTFKLILFALALFSISFSSLLWTLSLSISSQETNPITNKPIFFDKNLIFTSQEGYVYSIVPESGKSVWSKYIGGYPKQPVLLGDLVIVGSSNGNVFAIKKDGIVKWNISVNGSVYGMCNGAEVVYATTTKGLISIDKSGNVDQINNITDLTYTSPVTDGKRIIFGANKFLVSVKPNKNIEWVKEVANLWKSDPIIYNNLVIVGALDNNLYAFDAEDGFYRWKSETKGWVMGTPYVQNGNVYFGSNDGYVYSVSSADGKLRWKLKTKEAVQSTPVMGSFGGKNVIYAGSNDNNLYAIDDQDGKMLWKQSVKGWVNSPVLLGKEVIFGSHDGRIYAVSTERACTIESPEPDSLVGYKEIIVSGKAFSEYGSPTTYVRINEGEWAQIEVVNESWSFLLNPNNYEFDIIKLECKISDQLGQESSPFTSLSIIRTQNIPNEKMNIIFPAEAEQGKPFNISVKDSSGNFVINFVAEFQGKKYYGTGTVTIVPEKEGSLEKLVVSKPGFETKTLNINVSTSSNLALIAMAVVVVILIVGFIYYKKIVKRE